MAKRLFQATGWTATAVSDATALTAGAFQSIRGGSSTQKIDILEVLISGLNTSSVVGVMQLARASTLGTSTSALAAPNSDGPMDASTAALAAPALTYVSDSSGSTFPQRSNATSDARLNLGLNSFGGILRWNAAPSQQWNIIGNSATTGESILSASNAGAGGNPLISSHIMYEPY